MLHSDAPLCDAGAWAIIQSFAETDTTLSEIENMLRDHLGQHYDFNDWKPAFDAVFQAEGDSGAALAAINKLKVDALQLQCSDTPVNLHPPPLNDLRAAEEGLMQAVDTLKTRKRIIGTAPTLEDLLNPIQEHEIGESPYCFDGGDEDIIAMALAPAPEIVEVEDDSSGESEDEDLSLSYKEALDVCEKFGKLCVTHSDAHGINPLLLQRQARHLQSHLRHLELASQTQVTLTDMWGSSQRSMDVDT